METPIRYLKGVGPKMANRLQRLGIMTLRDLIYYFPFRHQDYSLITRIDSLRAGESVTVSGEIIEIKNNYTRFGKQIQKAKVKDHSGTVEVVWFNQPYLVKNLAPRTWVNLSGKANQFGNKLSLISPSYEITPATDFQPIHTARLVPIYPETHGVNSKYLRKIIAQALRQIGNEIKEFLPKKIINKYCLTPEKRAVSEIHFPKDKFFLKKARKRLAFDEFLFIHLNNLLKKNTWKRQKTNFKLQTYPEKIEKMLKGLPFKLTKAQEKAVEEIFTDLGRGIPMNRLLQGDVGSGKTVVAAISCYLAFLNKTQAVFMAPTEILANQHFKTFEKILKPLGVKTKLLTSTTSRKKSKETVRADVLIGTHALIFNQADFNNLSLVIVDEQHRFGVGQRTKLIKKGKSPHFLSMTATPIPRTVALTFYGDLSLSFLDEMPLGQRKTKTYIVEEQKRPRAYQWLEQRIKKDKAQAFVICPFIEESETLSSVKAAKAEFEKLKNHVFKKLKIGLLHGKMKSQEKDAVLERMQKEEIDILVATPIVEVGIDIPSVSIIFIEAAERFGLAQLHQLRGRIGRKGQEAYCFLMTESSSPRTKKRLKAMEQYDLGLKLAEIDLEMRGPGEIYGLMQHGFPKLKIALLSDVAMIKKTKEAAQILIKQSPDLSKFPKLRQHFTRSQPSLVSPN